MCFYRHKLLLSCTILSFTFSNPIYADLFVSIDHISDNPVYDGGGGSLSGAELGQTFEATASNFAGVQLQFSNLSNPVVDALVGSADLVLYDANDFGNPIELVRKTFLQPGDSVSMLTTILLDSPISTSIGARYFFSIDAVDSFGIGIHSFSASTYSGGSESILSADNTLITETGSGRDLSFQVISSTVPEPGTFAILGLGLAAMIARRRRRCHPSRGMKFTS